MRYKTDELIAELKFGLTVWALMVLPVAAVLLYALLLSHYAPLPPAKPAALCGLARLK